MSLSVHPSANGNHHTIQYLKQGAKLTFLSSNYNALVTVLVGPDEVEFTVHKGVVCARSTYFAAACSERWTEGLDTKIIRLIDTEPSTFQGYMDAMYDRLSYSSEKSSRPLIKLYILGDFLNDVKLRNRAMTLLVSLRRCPSYMSIELIWANTASGSRLRDWAMDMVRTKLGAGYFANSIQEYPAEFVQEIAVSLYVAGNLRSDPRVYFEAEGEEGGEA
jgi:hypothetical protein